MSSDTPPSLGLALADRQPIPIPLFAFLDWASGTEPEGDPRDFFALQFSGTVPSDLLAADPDLSALFAPPGSVLKVAFELLYAQYVRASTTPASTFDGSLIATAGSPVDRPTNAVGGSLMAGSLHATVVSPVDRYSFISTNAVGGFLTAALFWIPPTSNPDVMTGAGGSWSEPVLTVIGAPPATVAAHPISHLATWPTLVDLATHLMPGFFQPTDSATSEVPGSSTVTFPAMSGPLAAGMLA
jgi:hypothetical protein